MKGTPRPTRLGWLPLVAAPVLGVLSVMTVDSWLLLLAGASLGLGVAAILLRPRLLDLDVFLTLPPRASVGDTVLTAVVVRNHGRRTSPLATLTHIVPGMSDVTVVVEALEPGQTASLSVPRTATARGRTATSTARVVSSAPLGLVVTQAAGPVTTPVTIHPALLPVQLPPRRAPGADTQRAVPDRSGLDVHGIREWRPGDQARQVHWRSTARRGQLIVLEREVPHAGSLTVLVVGPTSQPGFEHLVCVVASTALAALAAGYTVSLLAAQPGLEPLRGSGPAPGVGRTELLDWCSALDPPGLADQAAIDVALAAAGRGGLLHVATTTAPAAWWELAGARADRSGVELAPLPGGRP